MMQSKAIALSLVTGLTMTGCTASTELGDTDTTDTAEIRGGGDAAAPGWMVAIQMRNAFTGGPWSHQCGGALFRPDFVVTAAHCVESYIFDPRYEVRVCVGATNLSDCDESRTARIFHSRMHTNWFPALSSEWDVGVIKLARAFPNELIALAEPQDDPPPGAMVQAIGFGRLADDSSPNTLQSVTYPVVSNEACQATWGGVSRIEPTMLCADADPSRGTCKGDSGGPLIYNGKLVGLTSFGATSRDGLCSGGADDVYTRVSAVRDWVLGQRF